MSRGAYILAEWLLDPVEIVCDRCDRRGRYRKAALLERYGGNTTMPDVLACVSADCRLRRDVGNIRCGAHYAATP